MIEEITYFGESDYLNSPVYKNGFGAFTTIVLVILFYAVEILLFCWPVALLSCIDPNPSTRVNQMHPPFMNGDGGAWSRVCGRVWCYMSDDVFISGLVLFYEVLLMIVVVDQYFFKA
mmetsp:Transcript_5360/g.8197  ORF Transcript_5360/g.8197 Transcript_5360/m.8197 type:complete len:117 (-) Transcript_5360:45-395(-)